MLLISQEEAEIAVAEVIEADVVTAGAVADAVMVVPLIMTGSRLVYFLLSQPTTRSSSLIVQRCTRRSKPYLALPSSTSV